MRWVAAGVVQIDHPVLPRERRAVDARLQGQGIAAVDDAARKPPVGRDGDVAGKKRLSQLKVRRGLSVPRKGHEQQQVAAHDRVKPRLAAKIGKEVEVRLFVLQHQKALGRGLEAAAAKADVGGKLRRHIRRRDIRQRPQGLAPGKADQRIARHHPQRAPGRRGFLAHPGDGTREDGAAVDRCPNARPCAQDVGPVGIGKVQFQRRRGAERLPQHGPRQPGRQRPVHFGTVEVETQAGPRGEGAGHGAASAVGPAVRIVPASIRSGSSIPLASATRGQSSGSPVSHRAAR